MESIYIPYFRKLFEDKQALVENDYLPFAMILKIFVKYEDTSLLEKSYKFLKMVQSKINCKEKKRGLFRSIIEYAIILYPRDQELSEELIITEYGLIERSYLNYFSISEK